MEITSAAYFIFTGVSLVVYWHLPQKWQWKLLLLDSMVFYFLNASPWTFLYILVSAASVYAATDYFIRIDGKGGAGAAGRKKLALMFTLILNVGILAVLKYTNLAIHTFNLTLGKWRGGVQVREVKWLAPLAVSFYTLQLVSYLLDCYWGIAEPERNLGRLVLYISYFPQMVSGPISRHSDIGVQLFAKHEFDYSRVVHGLKRIAWGLLKKLAVSNRAAVVVQALWDDPVTYSGFYVWIAAVGFVIQLYMDFSGCMDIVLGVSECFGIYLPENFNAPLFAKTIQEFWQRWHITLGTWLRDYIMNPLTKSRLMQAIGKKSRGLFGRRQGRRIPVYLSMLVLWLCMGLWHGDSWKYILGEGLWFWSIIVLGQILDGVFVRWKRQLHINEKSAGWQTIQVARTVFLFSVGNIFFHADSYMDALYRIGRGFRFTADLGVLREFLGLFISVDLGGRMGLLAAALSFVIIFVGDFCGYYEIDKPGRFFERHRVFRWIGYYLIVILLMLSLDIRAQEIIYAQF